MRTTQSVRPTALRVPSVITVIPSTLRADPGLTVIAVVLSIAVATALVVQPVLVLIAAVCVAAAALAADLSGVIVVPHLLVLACFGESLGVGSLTIGRLLAIVGLAAVIVRFRPGSGRRLDIDRWMGVAIGALVTVQLLGGFWAVSWNAWAFALGQTGLAVCFFVTFAALVVEPRQVAGLLRTYSMGAVAAACVGFVQALSGLRATGFQGDANIYAMYQVAAVPTCLALAAAARGRTRAWWLLATVPLLASIVASQSRGAFGALVVTVVVAGLVLTPRRRRVQIVAALVCVLIATTWAALSLTDRFDLSRIQNDRASGRLDLWLTGWHAFTAHPLTGLGSGGFKSTSVELLTTDPGVQLVRSHLLLLPDGIEVHSVYLEALADRGLPGLVVLLCVMLVTAHRLVKPAPRWATSAVGALPVMLLAFAVSAAFLSVGNSKLLWMLVGLASAVASQHRNTGETPSVRVSSPIEESP